MDSVFSHQIRRNLVVYVDYIIVKTSKGCNHAADLKDVMQSVRKYNMCLDPAKCSFRVQARKFLGYVLAKRGIEASIDKF